MGGPPTTLLDSCSVADPLIAHLRESDPLVPPAIVWNNLSAGSREGNDARCISGIHLCGRDQHRWRPHRVDGKLFIDARSA
jgi:hypothetical protein